MKHPDEVIIDQSEALISATVQTFAQCASTNHYINACMEAVLNDALPPACFIRFDRSLFIHSIHNNKVLRKLSGPVKKLVIGVLGYIVLCDSLETVKDVLHKLFTLTKNPMGTEQVSVAKLDSLNLVRTHTTSIETNIEDGTDEFAETNSANDSGASDLTYKDTLAYKWVNDILVSVEIREEAYCPPEMLGNIYCSERLQKYLLKLFCRVPMWSNIMCGVFGSSNYSPSSSASESAFKNLKKWSGIKTKLVNVFVDLHLTSLRRHMKIELCEQNLASIQQTTSRKPERPDRQKNVRLRSSSLPEILEVNEERYDPDT